MKYYLWDNSIPYNNTKSKLADMEYQEDMEPNTYLINFLTAIKTPEYRQCKQDYDSFTYHTTIKTGIEKGTYEDIPYVKSFLIDGSDRAVIVVPGGGFSYKSSDTEEEGHQGEGDLIAAALNECGISAFVLWYRTNPYRMPVELLDMQRAIRYVKFHAAEFGINPDKVGAIGFSGGGFEVAAHINIAKGTSMFPEGYLPDEIDQMDDSLHHAALIYPCLTLKYNETVAYPLFGESITDDPILRKKVIDHYDCIAHCNSMQVPQFLCYGTEDGLLPIEMMEEYQNELKKSGGEIFTIVLEGAGHGFGACSDEGSKKYRWWLSQYLDWVKEEFNALTNDRRKI